MGILCTFSPGFLIFLFFKFSKIWKAKEKQKGQGVQKKRETEGAESPILWFNLQMSARAVFGPGWSQEPGTQFGPPMWVAAIQVAELLPATFQHVH